MACREKEKAMRLPTRSSVVIEISMVNPQCKTMETFYLPSLAWLYSLRTIFLMVSTSNNIYTLNLKPFLLHFGTSLLPNGSFILSFHTPDFLLTFFLSKSNSIHFPWFLTLFIVVFLSKGYFHTLHVSPRHFVSIMQLTHTRYMVRLSMAIWLSIETHTLSPWEAKFLNIAWPSLSPRKAAILYFSS